MLSKPIKTDPRLLELLRLASQHKLSPAEIWDQRVSWSFGNLPEGNALSRQEVERIATETYGPRPTDPTIAAEVRAMLIATIYKARDKDWPLNNSPSMADAVLADPILGPRLLGQQGGDLRPGLERAAGIASGLFDSSRRQSQEIVRAIEAELASLPTATDPSPVQAGSAAPADGTGEAS